MYMVGQQMALLNPALFRLGQLAEYLAQVFTQPSVQHLPEALRDKNNVVLAPTSSDLNCHTRPSGFSLFVCLAAHVEEFPGWTP
jgi:hypothetical protein